MSLGVRVIWKPLLTVGSDWWRRVSTSASFCLLEVSQTVDGCGPSYLMETAHLVLLSSLLYILWCSAIWNVEAASLYLKWWGKVSISQTGACERHTSAAQNTKVDGNGIQLYRQAYAKQTSQLICPQKSVHHVYSITPDGLWMMQAHIGLRASAVQIRLALTLNVEEACKPGPCFISPGCITHF